VHAVCGTLSSSLDTTTNNNNTNHVRVMTIGCEERRTGRYIEQLCKGATHTQRLQQKKNGIGDCLMIVFMHFLFEDTKSSSSSNLLAFVGKNKDGTSKLQQQSADTNKGTMRSTVILFEDVSFVFKLLFYIFLLLLG
jgi:hypothetical protein